jgi:hypothetical protein
MEQPEIQEVVEELNELEMLAQEFDNLKESLEAYFSSRKVGSMQVARTMKVFRDAGNYAIDYMNGSETSHMVLFDCLNFLCQEGGDFNSILNILTICKNNRNEGIIDKNPESS